MKSKYGHRHIIDIVFTLALFCVFAASALLVVLIGANVYKSTTSMMGLNFETRTSLTYVSTKIRQNDSAGGVLLGELEGVPALILTREIDGDGYNTWIYHYEGALREIFAPENSMVAPQNGQKIMEVKSFKMETAAPGALRFTSVDSLGRDISLVISPRSTQLSIDYRGELLE